MALQTIWIPKPDKDPSRMDHLRPINLSEVSSKTHANVVQADTKAEMSTLWPENMYGAIPGRSTTDALFVVQETMARLNMRKQSFFVQWYIWKSKTDQTYAKMEE
jgi:hypothetical protein